MSDNLLVENLRTKWQPVLEHADMPEIKDEYRKNITAIMLENQEKALKEETISGVDALQADGVGTVRGFDPVLISLVRRAMPNLIAYDVCGVQPMSGPTGLIFAMRSKFTSSTGAEALFNEAPTEYSATAGRGGQTTGRGFPINGGTGDPLGAFSATLADSPLPGAGTDGPTQGGATFSVAGSPASDFENGTFTTFNEMAFSIDRTSVVAKTRALKAEYTSELAQDLKAVHGLDAETELANILSAEILAEINREVIRSIYVGAKLGAQQPDLSFKATSLTGSFGGAAGIGGIYSVDADSDGRWSAEKFRGLMFQIEREANQIAKETRRGKGNFIITTSDVASALAMSGFLNLTPAPSGTLEVDDAGNTFAGTLNGKIKVYIDPYSVSGRDYVVVGYRGSSPYDAGMFYCPYVPLQMVRAIGESDFQPKIGFKTRYGLVNNPFVADGAANAADPHHADAERANQYYRIFRVVDLHGSDVTAAS